jgi:hypothetical protein
MRIDAGELGKSMVAAARGSLGKDWKSARNFAEPELRRLANVLVEIGERAVKGEISEEEAKALLRIHRNTTATVMLAVNGLGILAVENAVNAALGVVRDTVNAATGFVLL